MSKLSRWVFGIALLALVQGCGDPTKTHNDNLPPVDVSKKDTLKPIDAGGPKVGGGDIAK
ncbi:MAG: hypothetical protein EXR99_03785 [Gemmataceae bacterium]|nr:hypothetical protein [Gemmataceae bacterium]